MEIKKTSKADLERKRRYFFLIGLFIACALLFCILEWKYQETTNLDIEGISDFITLDESIKISDQEYIIPENMPKLSAVYVEIFDVKKNTLPIKMPEIVSWEEAQEKLEEEIASLDKPLLSLSDSIYVKVEEMPEFPGGYQAFIQYIARQTRYPPSAVQKGITGKVICSFIVDKNGMITQVEIIQGVNPLFDKEISRVINNMPKWKPGKNRGKEVSVKYIVPVSFRL